MSKKAMRSSAVRTKMAKVMHEFKQGALHHGSKRGPIVRDRRVAVAIGLSQGRKALARKRSKKR